MNLSSSNQDDAMFQESMSGSHSGTGTVVAVETLSEIVKKNPESAEAALSSFTEGRMNDIAKLKDIIAQENEPEHQVMAGTLREKLVRDRDDMKEAAIAALHSSKPELVSKIYDNFLKLENEYTGSIAQKSNNPSLQLNPFSDTTFEAELIHQNAQKELPKDLLGNLVNRVQTLSTKLTEAGEFEKVAVLLRSDAWTNALIQAKTSVQDLKARGVDVQTITSAVEKEGEKKNSSWNIDWPKVILAGVALGTVVVGGYVLLSYLGLLGGATAAGKTAAALGATNTAGLNTAAAAGTKAAIDTAGVAGTAAAKAVEAGTTAALAHGTAAASTGAAATTGGAGMTAGSLPGAAEILKGLALGATP